MIPPDRVGVVGVVGSHTLSETQSYISITTDKTGVSNVSERGEVTCVNRSEHEYTTQVTRKWHECIT